MSRFNRQGLALAVAASLLPMQVMATNGMLMEGYGTESTGMGGTAAAHNVGTAGMINNPATLMMMDDGAQLDVSLGNLRPDVDATSTMSPGQPSASSGGDSYLMPNIGYVRKKGNMAYGVGVSALGGMGTEYAKDTFLGAATGEGARSEAGFGSVIFPIGYSVSDRLSIGGSIDYVWGGLDMLMGMPLMNSDGNGGAAPSAGSFADFSSAFGGSNVMGSASGALLNSMAPQIGGMTPQQMLGTSAVFDFTNDNDFTGQTNATGTGGKVGLTYKVSPQFAVGLSYRAKTALDDMEGSGSMRFVDMATGQALTNMDIPGEYTIKDFQLPAVVTAGLAYRISNATTVAADYSQIKWADTMKDINIHFVADANVPGIGGQAVDVALKQNWDDQNVLKLGVAHQVNNRLTLRGGVNIADNPIPDAYLNPLLPATVEKHFTGGFTYALNKNNKISGSLVLAPEVESTNSNTGIKVTHSQTNFQINYTRNF